jgi:hypothetical protein
MFPVPDGEVPYEEAWVRLPGSDGPFVAMEDTTRCFVQAGDHAITVVGTGRRLAAQYQVRRRDEWMTALHIGPRTERLPGSGNRPEWPVVCEGTTPVAA